MIYKKQIPMKGDRKMKKEKTILEYPFLVVQKENGKYWYKPTKGDETEMLLLYQVPALAFDQDYWKRRQQCDIFGVGCDGENKVYFAKCRTFTVSNVSKMSAVFDIITRCKYRVGDMYKKTGSFAYTEYILKDTGKISDANLMKLERIIRNCSESFDEYPGDFIEALNYYWDYILVLETDQGHDKYDYTFIFTDSDVVYTELGQKRIIERIERNRPIFPFY